MTKNILWALDNVIDNLMNVYFLFYVMYTAQYDLPE